VFLVLQAAWAAAQTPTCPTGPPCQGGPLPTPLPLFPPTNWWNLDITSAPVDPSSASFISFVGSSVSLHPDFGGVDSTNPPNGIFGFPYIVVSGTQPKLTVQFVTSTESDGVDHNTNTSFPFYPIPSQAITTPQWIEGGDPGNVDDRGTNDRHMLIVDADNNLLYELYNVFYDGTLPGWRAGSGAFFDMKTNNRRPETWTSADAAGLAMLPGLVRYDEAYQSSAAIGHAFRMTVRTTNGHVFPASHDAGSTVGALPMGARLRLKPTVTVTSTDPGVQRIVQALKTYGLIVADNGSDMFVSGTFDTRWDNGILNPDLGQLRASDFEVIQLGYTPSSPTSFFTLTPCRVADTRNPPGVSGGPALVANTSRSFPVGGICGIPLAASAVAINVTVVNETNLGDLRLYPAGGSVPGASTINFATNKVRANSAIISLGTGGQMAVQCDMASGSTDFLFDVTGYFQ
jgi:hypothetical protein